MAQTRAEMDNAELMTHLRDRGIDARVFTFDGGQTLVIGFTRITSEWGDPSLAELTRRRLPHLFPEDDPTVQHEAPTL